jgi:hypothetical protein
MGGALAWVDIVAGSILCVPLAITVVHWTGLRIRDAVRAAGNRRLAWQLTTADRLAR